LLGNFSAEVGRGAIFKPTTENENLCEIRTDNGVRVVKFIASKNLRSKVRCFQFTASINKSGLLQVGNPIIRLSIF
jgi:hypothetical protein